MRKGPPMQGRPHIDGLAAAVGSSAAEGPLPRRKCLNANGNHSTAMAFASSAPLRALRLWVGTFLLPPGAAHSALTPLRGIRRTTKGMTTTTGTWEGIPPLYGHTPTTVPSRKWRPMPPSGTACLIPPLLFRACRVLSSCHQMGMSRPTGTIKGRRKPP